MKPRQPIVRVAGATEGTWRSARNKGALTSTLAFVLTAACASHSGDDRGVSPSGGSPPQIQNMAGGGASAGRESLTAGGGISSGSSGGGNANASGSSTSSSAGSGGGGGDMQCRDQVPDAEWEANCLACAGQDPCAVCLCGSCAQALRDCDATEGCREIATCVQSSACVGIDCYCGPDPLTDCANGGGSGPCKDAILGAPGGKPPTLADPSGGPASDAVAQVALCMQDASRCGSVCN